MPEENFRVSAYSFGCVSTRLNIKLEQVFMQASHLMMSRKTFIFPFHFQKIANHRNRDDPEGKESGNKFCKWRTPDGRRGIGENWIQHESGLSSEPD